MYFIYFLIIAIVLFLLARPFTIIVHELGHAIPSLIFCPGKTKIFIGSFSEDDKKVLGINIGSLEVYFRYNPFAWKSGACLSEDPGSINKQIIITLAGSVTSFLFAVLVSYIAFTQDVHGFWKLFLVMFLFSAVIDLFSSLIPDDTQFEVADGSLVYNDGTILRLLFYLKTLPGEYNNAVNLFQENRYSEAAIEFEKMLASRKKDINLFRVTITSCIMARDYQKAKELLAEFSKLHKMDADDYCNLGITYSELGFNDEALEYYNKSLALNACHLYSLNNKAYTLNLFDRYKEAIPLFDQAIQLQNDFAYAYNNRGLAKIKLGMVDEGLKDISYSIELDENNSYSYRNLGIYHLDRGEFQQALELFEKAKQLDSNTHLIEDFIRQAKEALGIAGMTITPAE